MKRTTKGLILTILASSLLILGAFTCSVSAVENLPTVWVKVHKIQLVDDIENILEGEADWRYTITVSDGETLTTREFKCPPNINDIVVDRSDSFTDLKNQDVFVTITLYEDDAAGHETADISSSGTAYDCTYNLASNTLGGDETVTEGDYYKTSGDYDGSTETDENDANLWFAIFDNYDAPVAAAVGDQTIYTGETADFDGSFSTASEGSSIVKFEWDFEDDKIIDAEGEKTSHIYNYKGKHTCRLVVTDSIGVRSETTCLVTVANRDPTAEFTFSPSTPSIQDEMQFTDASSDPDGTVTSWLWDFGDGTDSTLQSPAHTYSQRGEWQVTLTVKDNDGIEASTTRTVAVVNLQPEALFECTPDPQAGVDIEFTDNSTDPENSSLTWLWDFGDGSTSELQNPTHKFETKGDYNVTLTVTDDENATSTYIMPLSVTESAQTLGGTPLWIIAVIVITIAAIAFLVLITWNRRQQSFPEMFTGSKDPVDCFRGL